MATAKKRILSLFMALIMTVGLLPIPAAAEDTGDAALQQGAPQYTADGNPQPAAPETADDLPVPPPEEKFRPAGISQSDGKLLRTLEQGMKTFRVYRLYKNEIPDKINTDFDASLFAPGGNDSPYFEVTVDMAALLAMDHMDTAWKKDGTWYVSLESCRGLGENNAERLEPFWSNVLASMEQGEAQKFQDGFAGNYRAYVLKQENAAHMDGIVNMAPPTFTTELYVNGQIVKTDTLSLTGRAYPFVTDEYNTFLQKTYGPGDMDWVALCYTTADGDVYQLTKGAWPVTDGETPAIRYTAVGGDAEVNVARFFITDIEKLTHDYTVESIYNYILDGVLLQAGRESHTVAALQDPGADFIPTEATDPKTYPSKDTAIGIQSYNRKGIERNGSFAGGNLVYTVTYDCVAASPTYTIQYELRHSLDNAPGVLVATVPGKTFPSATLPENAEVLAKSDSDVPYSSANIDGGKEKVYQMTEDAKSVKFNASTNVFTVPYTCKETTPAHTYTVNATYQYKLDGGEYVTAVDPQSAIGAPLPVTAPPSEEAVIGFAGGSPKAMPSNVNYHGKPIGEKSYKVKNMTTEGDFASDTLTYTVHYVCDDVTPTFPYQVRPHFNYRENGASDYQDMGYGAPLTKSGVTRILENSTVWAEAASGVTHMTGTVSNTYQKAERYAEKDVERTGSLTDNSLLYTVEYYCEAYTVGGLTITKAFRGDPVTAPENLCFTVTGPESYAVEVAYSAFVGGSYTIPNLTPGDYTVTEHNAELPGYSLGVALPAYSVRVQAQKTPTPFYIANTYTGKEYTILFDAGHSGKVQTLQSTPVSGTWVYRWSEINDGTAITHDWVGRLLSDAGSKLVYTFTMGQYQAYLSDLSVQTPGLTDICPGYSSDGAFYQGGVAYTNLADAMAAMLLANETSAIYAAAYAPNRQTPYAVQCFYQNADGTYPAAATATWQRTGETNAMVSLTLADQTPDATLPLPAKNYTLDCADGTTAIKGDGSTVLHISFRWQGGVTYQYVGATAAINAAYPLVQDSKLFGFGFEVSNQSSLFAPNGTQVRDDNGTWTLQWNALTLPMPSTGVTFVGTWRFAPAGQATAQVQFADESGNEIFTDAAYSTTADYGSPYDFTKASDVKTLNNQGIFFSFLKDYIGAFAVDHADEEVAYTGSIPSAGRTLTRVYTVTKAPVTVEKTYSSNLTALPADFTVTISDKITGAVAAVLTTASATPAAGGKLTWVADLPVGRTYTFTESNHSNGARWVTVLTAQRAVLNEAGDVVMQNAPVTNFTFDASVTATTATVALHNAYTYTAPDDDRDDDDPAPPAAPIPDDPTPTTDLPDGEVPLTDLPDTEVPVADVPATGDSTAMWAMAAAVSGLGLVWLLLFNKKRERDTA